MSIRNFIFEMSSKVIAGGGLDAEEAVRLSTASAADRLLLFAEAARIRDHFIGNRVFLCSIINAKSGRCSENCAFCAQSVYHDSGAPVYPLVNEDEMVRCAILAEQDGAGCYGIVTSGTGINNNDELDRVCRVVTRIKSETGISPSCSLGIIDVEKAVRLKNAGMETYHHNIETARSFFPNICTTHDYEDDLATISAAKSVGLKVCCGGIFGLGETFEQRVEMAITLRELGVDSIPLNFLNPVAGTLLEKADNLTPMECLTIISVYRFLLPDKRLSVCGGRERNLRELQSWIFLAGASGTMTGNYLTTPGRPPELDKQMLRDLEMDVEGCCGDYKHDA
ncbi:MAG: biotin synthase BioB [Desulfuromonadaceae bacterium]|nr:biotin synthase BioB [Desulfuromonadaceae bacterium]MDD2855491.1 biotin synthase BioB [Desulfuromonadaceae bacterium]